MAKNNGDDQSRNTRRLMHHDAAGKVVHSLRKQAVVTARQQPATPDPVSHGRIAKQHPEAGKQHDKAISNALNIGADDQGGCDDREGHLKGEEQHLRDGSGQGVCVDADQERLIQPAPVGVAFTEGDGIARGQPENAHQTGD